MYPISTGFSFSNRRFRWGPTRRRLSALVPQPDFAGVGRNPSGLVPDNYAIVNYRAGGDSARGDRRVGAASARAWLRGGGGPRSTATIFRHGLPVTGTCAGYRLVSDPLSGTR